MKTRIILIVLIWPFMSSAQDSLRFISGTTGAACQAIAYQDGYLFTGTGSTFRVYDATTPIPYGMLFEYRYQSAIMDMVIKDHYLYIAANYDGMTKWDIIDPSYPIQVYTMAYNDQHPVVDITLAGDSIYLAQVKKMSVFKDHGISFTYITEFGDITGTARILGADIKDNYCAYVVADVFSDQNGVYLFSINGFTYLSHHIQTFCTPENVIWGQNNNLLHVLGGTNTVNGSFYTLDVTDPFEPVEIYSDTVWGFPLGIAIANPLNAVNINDTIYVATTAGLKPDIVIDTAFIYVYDATNPSNIHLINYLPAGLWHFDLAINYPLYYVASEWYGIKTVNFSDFFHPQDLGNTLTGGWNTGSDAYGDYLAVANEGYGFKLYNISNLEYPELINTNHDPGFCHKVRFSEDGQYLYTLNASYESFRIYEVPSLTRIGDIFLSVGSQIMRVWHDRVFVKQPLGNVLNIIDVSDPANPEVVNTVPLVINDMFAYNNKLYVANNNKILIYDITGDQFELILEETMELLQAAKAITAFNDQVFVYITLKGLVRYQLIQSGNSYELVEQIAVSMPEGKPSYLAADTFGLYVAYQVKGLYSYDWLTMEEKDFFRGELDLKGYTNQYGIQELYCRDSLIFLSEYFTQTSILTNDDNFPLGVEDQKTNLETSVDIYPNPATNEFAIRLKGYGNSKFEFYLFDLVGREVFQTELNHQPQCIVRPAIPDGLYLWRLVGNDQVLSGKLIFY